MSFEDCRIFTLGLSESITYLVLIEILEQLNIKTIIDIRSKANSWNDEDLNSANLKAKLSGKSIEYNADKTLSTFKSICKLTNNDINNLLSTKEENKILFVSDIYNIDKDLKRLKMSNLIARYYNDSNNNEAKIFHIELNKLNFAYDKATNNMMPKFNIMFRLHEFKEEENGKHEETDKKDEENQDQKYQEEEEQQEQDDITKLIENPARFEMHDKKSWNEGMSYLKENGYLIFKNVLNEKEIEHAMNLMWNWLEGLGSGIKRDDITTWTNENWPDRQKNGVLAWNGIGQSEFLWYLRSHSNIIQIFRQLWKTDNLLTSFDGAGIFRPWQYNNEWKTKSGWLHVDQNPTVNLEFECLQGLINLIDNDESTGGFYCIPKTHHDFAAFGKRNQKLCRKSKNLVFIPRNDVNYKKERHIINLKSGDFLLWDSRLIHSNISSRLLPSPLSLEQAAQKKWNLIRCVAYICMTPIKNNDDQDFIFKREHAVYNNITTNHMPWIYSPNNPESLRTKYGKKLLKIPKKPDNWDLTETQWRLVKGT